ncbi:3-deoxy-manno-octulosonate cytidylyltransferase [Desulfovibrio aminophilus]|uniref:3-deoxy-manno-octulosonate cytidylyltransferase n=1 Tax=Desulfovibrio aminophilus TaxID=81425 RepID=UPI00339821D1
MKTLPECYGVIPARYGSSRFPGKPLADILGRPMFWHVHRRASLCPELKRVVLATDDERILDAARSLDVSALMTRADHASGTDRVLEAALALGVPDDAVVVNIQGDEPALDPAMLSELVAPFADPDVLVATLARALDPEEAPSPDRVKVVLDRKGNALYFSRAAIPWGEGGHLLHVGLYAFRMEALRRFAALEQTPLEIREKLEQLRLLENGIPIRVALTDRAAHAVDRPQDLDIVRNILMEQN